MPTYGKITDPHIAAIIYVQIYAYSYSGFGFPLSSHIRNSHWQVTFYKILVDEFLYLTAREFCFVVPKSHNCALNLIINKEERSSKLMSFNCIAIVFPKGTHFRVSMQPCHYCLSSTKYIIDKGRSLKDGDSFEDDIRFHSNV